MIVWKYKLNTPYVTFLWEEKNDCLKIQIKHSYVAFLWEGKSNSWNEKIAM